MPRPVRLIGAPTDCNSSFRRGPAAAPTAIRAAMFSEAGNAATELGGELGIDLELRDDGDLPLDETPADDARIESAVTVALANGEAPLVLGGDHSITYPIVRGVAKVYPSLSILHIDAHSDLYDELLGNRRSHASPFARIMEEGLAQRLVQVGIRTLNAHQRVQAERFGVEIVPMREFEVRRVPIPDGPLYVSIDIDGVDPAHAPGVSHQEPGGLTTREVIDLLARLRASQVVGGDIVELNPSLDVNGMTAGVAAKLAKELAAVMSGTGVARAE